MIFRIALIEFKRLITRPRFIIMFSLLVLFGIGLTIFTTSGLYGAPDESGKWTSWSVLLGVALPIYLLTPLFIGFIAGASLAEDRYSGYQQFILVRTGSRITSVASKVAGIMAASFFGALATFVILTLFTFAIFPSSPIDSEVANFSKEFFKESPFLYLGLTAIMIGLGASAMAGSACFASIWVSNPYIVGSVPIGFLFLSIVFESIAKYKYFEVFPMLTLQNQTFTFPGVASAWFVYIIFFYGLTIVFFENKLHLVKIGAHK